MKRMLLIVLSALMLVGCHVAEVDRIVIGKDGPIGVEEFEVDGMPCVAISTIANGKTIYKRVGISCDWSKRK